MKTNSLKGLRNYKRDRAQAEMIKKRQKKRKDIEDILEFERIAKEFIL